MFVDKKELDSWWERKLERELSGQRYQIKKDIMHEVNEISLCLNRENPNVEMALARIRNIKLYFGIGE